MGIKRQKICCLIVLMLFAALHAFAGIEPYQNFKKGTLAVNDFVLVQDEKFKNTAFTWSNITNISVKNAISLEVLDDIEVSSDFSCQLTLKIEYWSTPSQTTPTVIDNVNLNVDYSKQSGASFKGKDIYRFNNGYQVKVTITAISSPQYGSQLPAVLQLTSNIVIDRKYVFQPFLPIDVTGGAIAGETTGANISHKLELFWAAILGAEEYDLEWLMVDEDSEWSALAGLMELKQVVSEAQIDAMFRNNSARVTTSQQTHQIALIDNSKYIVVRIRQASFNSLGVREQGSWSYRKVGQGDFYIWPLTNWFQSGLNWQYSASYSEEGKKKEVVQFFDGTLRERQIVTTSSTDTVAVAQENVFDEFGRVAANILPVPIRENKPTPFLHYFPGLNKNNSGGIFTYADLDVNDCGANPGILNKDFGASRYYSEKNTFQAANKNYNYYIPDAEGYPFSVTQYTNDNTGRMKSVSAVGAALKPAASGADHTTKYFYSKPAQWELDRVFGNDVGFANHYLKNMTVDPNGQLSISYLNSSGKTIATALAGKSPGNVDSLSTIAPEKRQVVDLFDTGQFKFDATELKLKATTSYTVTIPGNVTFNYDIPKLISLYGKDTFKPCSNCYYELTINVTDDCGVELDSIALPVQIGSKISDCLAEGTFSSSFGVNFARLGEVNISFTLAMSPAVIENFADKFINEGQVAGKIKKRQEFVLDYLNNSRFSDCFTDCATARQKLGTLANFSAAFNTKLTELGEIPAVYSALINQTYNRLLDSVVALEAKCVTQPTSPCQSARQVMLLDVSPGGQYASLDASGNLNELAINVIDLYYHNGVFNGLPNNNPSYQATAFTKDDGTESSPFDANLSKSELIKYWRPEWAEYFLSSHPEYCKLQFCEQNPGSVNWDTKIGGIESVSELQTEMGISFTRTSNFLVAYDSFFQSGAGSAYASAMSQDLNLYSTNALGQSTLANKNVFEFVDLQLYCQESGASTNTGSAGSWGNCIPVSACRVPDREWQLYREFYLRLKQKYFEKVRDETTCQYGCPVGSPQVLIPNTTMLQFSGSEQSGTTSIVEQQTVQSFENETTTHPCPNTNGDFEAVKSYFHEGSYILGLNVRYKQNKPCNKDVTVQVYVFRSPNYYEYLGPVTIPAGQTAVNVEFTVDAHSLIDSYIACGTLPCNQNCKSELLSKISRFPSTSSVSTVVPAGIDELTDTSLQENIKSSCEAMADVWMEKLASGLVGKNPSDTTLLRLKLIELCKLGGDQTHPDGSSSLPSGYVIVGGQQCSSFGDVIKAIFGSFTSRLNPWLITSPAPYGPKPQTQSKNISRTTPEICSQLASLRPLGLTDAQFFAHLQTRFGAAMQLSYSEFQLLLKGCSNCKYILDKDIKLPLFMEPGTTSCISKTTLTNDVNYLSSQVTDLESAPSYLVEEIVGNFLNLKYGFTLSLDRYQEFSVGTETELCNVSPADVVIEEDPYACIKNYIQQAYGYGDQDYKAYVEEEKRQFRLAYISTCAAINPVVKVSSSQKIYHYTLYYYDQAGNLVRTVPPEGVVFLTDTEMAMVKQSREHGEDACTYNGPTENSVETAALQTLSDRLNSTETNAIEFWLYSQDSGSRQFIASTPDMKYMMQVCASGNFLNVDIYKLTQDGASDVSMVLSNHVTANISNLLPLLPWTHVVVQGTNLSSGALQIWINGTQYAATTSSVAGCSWEIKTGPLTMPRNLSALKHLRLYNGRLMTAMEIATNAASPCLQASDSNARVWYRFNSPTEPGPTTVGDDITKETQYNGVYPAHGLITTYAYNSTNQVIKQNTPDAGTSKFWYDYTSRLVVSQNAKQQALNDYSYTKYDSLSRITEVGQKRLASAWTIEPGAVTGTDYGNFIVQGSNSQLTQTIYDTTPSAGNGIPVLTSLTNLRSRVSASVYRETASDVNINASYYSYDLAGNVKTLYQQINGLFQASGLKKLDYEYDQISGKVNFLSYQHGQNDRFYYAYDYDAGNRLTEVWSSTEANVAAFGLGSKLSDPDRKLDATYSYYLHGPLRRMELGRSLFKVQGLDYVYTLQGWLKGVNKTRLNNTEDVGKDGGSSNYAEDAIGYSLGYFSDDYKPIGSSTGAFRQNYQSAGSDETGNSLFNGNISSATYATSAVSNGDARGYTYRYDQLNRIKMALQHDLGSITTNWSASSKTDSYKETFTYDGNGNILTLTRNDATGLMDNLSYNYNKPNGKLVSNMLYSLLDTKNAGNSGELTGNRSYSYDGIGNLITDSLEGISNIEWSVYGKIKAIAKSSGSLAYSYDPSGNRVSKSSGGTNTWYVRDAQGNPIAVYNNIGGVNWIEQHLYGSSRLGMWLPDINPQSVAGTSTWSYTGKKRYELTNHLGNVLSVISDHRTISQGKYNPAILSAQDYYTGGMIQPGRTYNSSVYRYGFNGKENDNDVKGTGNQQDYGMRVYDPRVQRFLSVDPISDQYPWYTPYSFAGNMPISSIDLDGAEPMNNMADSHRHEREALTAMYGEKEAERQFNINRKAEAAGAGAAILFWVEALVTKGKISSFLATSEAFSIFEHNQARTPEKRFEQKKRENSALGNAFIGWAGGSVLGKAFSLTSEIPIVKNIQAKLVSAHDVNNAYNKKGWYSPYKSNATLAELNLPDEVSGAVRLSGPNNIQGDWFTTMNEIKGLSPLQLKDKFALKYAPTSMTPVTLKGNFRVGEAAEVPDFGKGGGFQIEALPGSQVKYGKTTQLK